MYAVWKKNNNTTIFYYKLSDSSKYSELKTQSLKVSEKDSIINYPNIYIEDYTLKDSYIRFYEIHEPNRIPTYEIFLFSKKTLGILKI